MSADKTFQIKVESLDVGKSRVMVNLSMHSEQYTTDVGEKLIELGYAQHLAESEKTIKNNLTRNYPEQDMLYVPLKQSGYTARRPEYASQTSLPRMAKPKTSLHQKEKDDDRDDVVSSVSSFASDAKQNSEFVDEDENSYAGFVDMRGPYSPLEISYYSLINAGHSKRVTVERDSINYVTLDDDPLNESTRLMVASAISLNTSGTSIIARRTCLLPKLPGLSSICCMLFTPTIEIRTDKKETCFTGALCGLGYDEVNRVPIYTDNDIECVFDATIDVKDMAMINSVRMAINMVIGSEEEVNNWT